MTSYLLTPNSNLPRHIFPHAAGYRVRVIRGAVKLEAYLPASPTALAEAIQIRDRFLIAAGPTLPKLVKTYTAASRRRSNTGHPGISETMKWVRYRPIYCFTVYLGKKHRPQMKRVYFGQNLTRHEALKKAIAIRASVVPISKEVSHA